MTCSPKTGPLIIGVLPEKAGGPHAWKQVTDEQIIGVLREADAGASTGDLCRRHGISPATFYKRKRMGVSEARRLRQLNEENRKLKQLLAQATLDNHVLREQLRKNASGLLPDAKPCTISRSGGATASVAPAG